MRFLIVLALVATSGCAPRLQQSSPAGGIIRLGAVIEGRAKAAEMATAECAKHGRDARVTNIDILSETAAYECVSR